MPQRSSPTVRRRELGALLRGYREARRLTALQAAEAIEVSPSMISRLENAQRQPVIIYVRELCRLYELDEPTTERLVRMARESREEGWWQRYDLESPTATYLSLEAAATQIRAFENYAFPGLLQTREYAEVVVQTLRGYLPDEQITQTIDSRVARQKILAGDGAVQFHAIVGETALNQQVGGAEVMAAQIRNVLVACERPNVTVQILEFSVGAHPAMDGPFTVMSFAEEHMGPVVYAEGPLGQIFQDSAAEVDRRLEVFTALSELAASPDVSQSLLRARL
ncbi:helix-turn-helix domain-containing protein [Krasilnikovia sp. M28-CT-15]|uniref:helix-turn-helix domain-containing protein n=1 Tax=Krasilnikovia sp. M28-CT-15 TaxID=3373540 RepID=UPI00399C7B73